MRRFKDSEGRAWDVTINVAAVKRVRDLLGVNVPGLVGDGMRPLAALMDDPAAFVDVLFVLCRDEARAADVTDEGFGAAMGGDALAEAADAFVEELVDFSHPRVRAGLRAALGAAGRLRDEILTQGMERMASLDLKGLARSMTGSSGASPGPSASTPAPSPSGSSS